jgi:hypothetical protein
VPREEVFAVIDAAFAPPRKTLQAALARSAGGGRGRADPAPRPGWTPGTRGEAFTVPRPPGSLGEDVRDVLGRPRAELNACPPFRTVRTVGMIS